MLTVKGFWSLAQLKDNGNSATSVFGEITSFCRTFSKDVKEYSTPTYAGLELLVFSSKDNQTPQAIGVAHRDRLLEMGNWIYDQGLTINASWRLQDFIAALDLRFSGYVSEITCGPLSSDGTRRMPEWVKFRLTIDGSPEISAKIWLRNSAFEAQYDEYDIVIVPPVDRLDDLLLAAGQVQNLLESRPQDRVMELVEEAKDKKPNTVTVAQTVKWYNPAQLNNTITLNWYAVVYGPKGNTTDLINAAITSYIESHSNEDIESWKVILPDLFRNTHFVVFPRWDKYAIPNRTSIAGIYSPIMTGEESLLFAKSKLPPEWTLAHVNAALQFTHHPYRSIGLVVVGGPDNRNNMFLLSQVVNDYLGVESTHEDFNRQSELTKQWVTMMGNLLRAAENLTTSLDVPAGMRTLTRNNITFVSQKLDNIEYMVAARFNYATV